jgi:DNA-binding CsgD family transcriptional regulator
MSAASFYADQNDPKALAECIDILSAIAQDNQALEIRAARAAVFAEDRWIRGEIDKAVEWERQALEDYRKQGLPLETALVARRLGLMLASKGEVAGAETVWRESMEIARDLGLRPLLDVLDRDRRATGTSVSQASLAEGAGLTKRQLDVLRLIATGLTNKEAAAQLNLSPRTVEMHVASVLERLNCRARTEAIQKATKLGLV